MGIDLGKTDPQWSLLGRKLAPPLAMFVRMFALEMFDRLTKRRTQVMAYTSPVAQLKVAAAAPVTLSGVNLGVNTAADGGLYVEVIDAGGGDWTVKLNTATGQGSGTVVAQGTAAADNPITLAAANSSGLTGIWELPASPVASADDTVRLWVCQDLPVVAENLWDGSDSKDAFARNAFEDALAFTAPALRSLGMSALKSFFNRFCLSDGKANPTPQGNSFLSGGQVSLLDLRSTEIDGAQVLRRDGWFERATQAMSGETTGSTQYVAKRTVAAAAGTFPASNRGVGTIASHTPFENILAGRVVGTCIRGVDTTDFGKEAFSLLYHFDDADRPPLPLGVIQVARDFAHANGLGGVSGMKILRSFSKTNDGSNNILAAGTAFTVSGESNANSDEGDWHVSTEANGENWDVLFYKSSGRAALSLVAKATGIAGGAVFQATAMNTSGLTINGQLGGSLSAVSNVTLHARGFYLSNTNGIPDSFEVVVSVTTKGLYQTLLAEAELQGEIGARLNSTTAGSETFQEGWVKQNTFPPFVVQDN